jgi:post-segregation antitoxin (ccd killing protein)
VESALEEVIRAAEQQAWLTANQEAIAEYNALVQERGVFSDDWRRF